MSGLTASQSAFAGVRRPLTRGVVARASGARCAAPTSAGFFDNFGKSSDAKKDAEFKKQQARPCVSAFDAIALGACATCAHASAHARTNRRLAQLRAALPLSTAPFAGVDMPARAGLTPWHRPQEILAARRSGKNLNGVAQRRKEVANYMKLSKEEQRKFRAARAGKEEPVVRTRRLRALRCACFSADAARCASAVRGGPAVVRHKCVAATPAEAHTHADARSLCSHHPAGALRRSQNGQRRALGPQGQVRHREMHGD
jgi:hypothetical protein